MPIRKTAGFRRRLVAAATIAADLAVDPAVAASSVADLAANSVDSGFADSAGSVVDSDFADSDFGSVDSVADFGFAGSGSVDFVGFGSADFAGSDSAGSAAVEAAAGVVAAAVAYPNPRLEELAAFG